MVVRLVFLSAFLAATGCTFFEEHGEELAEKAAESAEKVMEKPDIVTILAEVGALIAFAISLAVGGKQLKDRRKMKAIDKFLKGDGLSNRKTKS